MDMQSLQRQIEEVRYLHSLWYQGPPQNPNPNPNPNPKPNPHLRPLALPSFKKTKKKEKKIDHLSNQSDPSVSRSHWPTEPPPKPQPQTGWADPIPTPTRPATAEEQAKLIAARSQQNALKSCRDFLYCSDSDEDEDDHEPMEDGEEETEKYDFFLRLFSDDDDLRSYYEKNFEHGDFSCLVCQGIGKRSGKNIGRHLGKKFGACVALLNHSVFITKKTKGRIGKIAHRAFGRVICRVIGWNFDRLPSIVVDSEEPLGRTLAKAKSKEVCPGGNDASNQEKTSEPMDSGGTDGCLEACPGGNDASNKEKTSEPMDSGGTDGCLEACPGGNDASNQEKTSEPMDSVGTDGVN